MAWRALRQLTSSSAKSAGRNSAGRITIFHRGGGAKRLQRTLDLKRSTSSMGVVERIEYDPNRSSRIALVRWQGGPHQRKRNSAAAIDEEASARSVESGAAATTTTATNIRGSFAFSSLNPTAKKPNSAKDVFVSAFLSPKAASSPSSSVSLGRSSAFGFPRIAVAAANPAFFVARMRERVVGGENNNTFSLSEIRKHSSVPLAHRMKRKAALSWHSFKRQEEILLGRNQPKTTTDQPKKNGARKEDWAAVTYVIATHNLEKGKKMMVMNCSKL